MVSPMPERSAGMGYSIPPRGYVLERANLRFPCTPRCHVGLTMFALFEASVIIANLHKFVSEPYHALILTVPRFDTHRTTL